MAFLPCPRRLLPSILIVVLSLGATASGDQPVSRLSAENLLLIVNKNEPAGQRLAEHYAKQRQIPAGRIVVVDAPHADELTYRAFHEQVAPTVRQFLKDHKLEEQVTCLVTFYGVPLRVGPRVNTAEQTAEYRAIDQQLQPILAQAVQAVATLEEVALQLNADFKPPTTSQEMPALPLRADTAVKSAIEALGSDGDAERRAQRFSRLMASVEKLYGPLETQERLALPVYQRYAARPVSPEQQAELRKQTAALITEIQALNPKALADAAARERLRELFTTQLGQLRTLQLMTEQKLRLETRETQASVDSELACLWWPQEMLRYRWHENPLNYRLRYAVGDRPPSTPAARPRTLMVARLDAPTEQIVRGIIDTSLKVEAEGLAGIVGLDARGKAPTDAYGKFDALIRDLATELREKSRAEVRLDDADEVFAAGSVRDVSLYCGWYSLRNYVPGMAFKPGAVGYHVASGEMISLHHPTERGWCANLLKDGVVATLGPVAEPYLHAFPMPTEFFPLLMTGKLKLAEVYWLTNPLVSWMNTLIGDPLYAPFAASPAIKDTEVSHRLRVIFAQDGGAATQPAGRTNAARP